MSDFIRVGTWQDVVKLKRETVITCLELLPCYSLEEWDAETSTMALKSIMWNFAKLSMRWENLCCTIEAEVDLQTKVNHRNYLNARFSNRVIAEYIPKFPQYPKEDFVVEKLFYEIFETLTPTYKDFHMANFQFNIAPTKSPKEFKETVYRSLRDFMQSPDKETRDRAIELYERVKALYPALDKRIEEYDFFFPFRYK